MDEIGEYDRPDLTFTWCAEMNRFKVVSDCSNNKVELSQFIPIESICELLPDLFPKPTIIFRWEEFACEERYVPEFEFDNDDYGNWKIQKAYHDEFIKLGMADFSDRKRFYGEVTDLTPSIANELTGTVIPCIWGQGWLDGEASITHIDFALVHGYTTAKINIGPDESYRWKIDKLGNYVRASERYSLNATILNSRVIFKYNSTDYINHFIGSYSYDVDEEFATGSGADSIAWITKPNPSMAKYINDKCNELAKQYGYSISLT